MSSYSGYSYQEEERRRVAEREAAPKTCPHCGKPINESLGRWDKPRYHCGADKCRKAASRANIAERKRQERSQARSRVLVYCEQHLDRDQKQAVMNMCDMLMQFSYDEGHQIAEAVISVIEAQRCKHDRISQLEQNAAIWKRRALKSEEQLKDRIAELEAELYIFNMLESTIHSIAQRQLARQPDPQERQPVNTPEPEDDDRRAVLAMAGIKPVAQALAEGEQEDDDTESDEEYDEEDLEE